MTDDALRSVAQLTHRLRRAQDALAAAPRGGQAGTDETGSITIIVDDDGTAQDVRVAADWRRRLSLAQVGPAVVAADADAARRHQEATAAALAAARESTSDGDVGGRFPDDGPGPGRVPDGDAVRWLTPVPPTDRRRRSLTELVDAVLAAVHDLDVVAAHPPPVVGTGAGGAVRLALAQGRITECTADPAWLARQDEVTLAHALREAISMAATAALAARRPFIDYQQRLEAIVAEARATLHELSQGPRP